MQIFQLSSIHTDTYIERPIRDITKKKGKGDNMKHLHKVISLISAFAVSAALGAAPAFAESNISVVNSISNSVISGDLNIQTVINGAFSDAANISIADIIQNTVVGGNININHFTGAFENIINPIPDISIPSIGGIFDNMGIPDYSNGLHNAAFPEPDFDTPHDNGLHNTEFPEPDFDAPYENGNVSANFTETAKRVTELTNAERANCGLASLTLDPQLTEMAEYKARDMVTNGFSHDGSYGDLSDLLSMYGVSYNAAGENIAMGQQSPEEVVTAWMNSQGHRENILNSSFGRIGIGFTEANGTTYWVMELAN